MSHPSRRLFLRNVALSFGTLSSRSTQGFSEGSPRLHGQVVGEPTAERVGMEVLEQGGNAVDAIVAAALTAAVAAPHQTGIGGYGMSAIFALESGKRVVAVDGNSTAPAAMTPDIFRRIAAGEDKSRANEVGWLSAGVPGVLAGLQLSLDRFGTRSFAELVRPAIRIAREGIPWPASLVAVVAKHRLMSEDAGSKSLYFPNGAPLRAGELFRNLALAELLESLARDNSVTAFYQGDIAQRIADEFQRHGGLVTASDLAAYRPRCVEPLSMEWNGYRIHTPPLTSGGLTVLQTLQSLRAMNWSSLSSRIERTHARIEAARWAWNDRLKWLGDPDWGKIPVDRLVSVEYAEESASQIRQAVANKTLLAYPVKATGAGGTISLSAIDREGNMAALTLTHGEAFGSKVTVEGLGLTLGHGMSRFDPRPDHPNSPGPGKRPLHNMVPTIVSRDRQAVIAIGGRGGRRIINAVTEFLTQSISLEKSLKESIASPRFHTEGDPVVAFEKSWPKDEFDALAAIGYSVKSEANATLSAVAVENGKAVSAMR